VHEKLDELIEFLLAEEEASIKRVSEEGGELIPSTVVMFAFTSGRKSGGASSAFRQHA
jgi:hypothetical protein